MDEEEEPEEDANGEEEELAQGEARSGGRCGGGDGSGICATAQKWNRVASPSVRRRVCLVIYWPSAHPAAVPGWRVRGLMDVGWGLVVGLSRASGRQV